MTAIDHWCIPKHIKIMNLQSRVHMQPHTISAGPGSTAVMAGRSTIHHISSLMHPCQTRHSSVASRPHIDLSPSIRGNAVLNIVIICGKPPRTVEDACAASIFHSKPLRHDLRGSSDSP